MRDTFVDSHLKVFVEVAEHLSFSRAAKRLFLTQPSVSRHVKALEQTVGAPLFDHRKRNLALTDVGQALFEYAKRMVALADEAESALTGLGSVIAGHINLAASNLWEPLLIDLLISFQLEHQEVKVTARFSRSQDIFDMLLENKAGLGLVTLSPKDPRLETTVIAERETAPIVIVPRAHPLADLTSVQPAALEEFPMIYFPLQPGPAASYFERLGVKPNYRLEVESLDSIKKAVEAGLGISVLAEYDLDPDPTDRFTRIPLAGPVLKRSMSAVRSKHRYFPAAERALLAHISANLSFRNGGKPIPRPPKLARQ